MWHVAAAAVERAASASAMAAVALAEEVAPEAAATALCARTLVGRKNTAHGYPSNR